jgi:hypothetical protein
MTQPGRVVRGTIQSTRYSQGSCCRAALDMAGSTRSTGPDDWTRARGALCRTAWASDPTEPMKMEKIDLVIREYTGQQLASLGICRLLKRKWSQTICRGQHQGLLSRLPAKFDLLDRGSLDLLKSGFTVGKERQYDQVKDMALRPDVTEIGCDKQSQFCTAMVEVSPGLLAVWTVWNNGKTGSTAEQMADTQGTAIVQFVRRAIGPAEDPTLVKAD